MDDLKLTNIVKLTKNEINEFKKKDLVELLFHNKEIEHLEAMISTDIKEIKDSLNNIKDNVLKHLLEENKKLREKVTDMEAVTTNLTERVVRLERAMEE